MFRQSLALYRPTNPITERNRALAAIATRCFPCKITTADRVLGQTLTCVMLAQIRSEQVQTTHSRALWMGISFLAKIKFSRETTIQDDMRQFFCDTIGVRRLLGVEEETVREVHEAASRMDDVLAAPEFERVRLGHIALAALNLLAMADESFA